MLMENERIHLSVQDGAGTLELKREKNSWWTLFCASGDGKSERMLFKACSLF